MVGIRYVFFLGGVERALVFFCVLVFEIIDILFLQDQAGLWESHHSNCGKMFTSLTLDILNARACDRKMSDNMLLNLKR